MFTLVRYRAWFTRKGAGATKLQSILRSAPSTSVVDGSVEYQVPTAAQGEVIDVQPKVAMMAPFGKLAAYGEPDAGTDNDIVHELRYIPQSWDDAGSIT